MRVAHTHEGAQNVLRTDIVTNLARRCRPLQQISKRAAEALERMRGQGRGFVHSERQRRRHALLGRDKLHVCVQPAAQRLDSGGIGFQLLGEIDQLIHLAPIDRFKQSFASGKVPVQGPDPDARTPGNGLETRVRAADIENCLGSLQDPFAVASGISTRGSPEFEAITGHGVSFHRSGARCKMEGSSIYGAAMAHRGHRMDLLLTLTVNGTERTVTLDDPRVTLLDLLRERLDLTGTKKGCDRGQCGACTVLLDGRRVNACLTLAISHDGAAVTTIEGLASGDALHPVQAAFIAHDGFQCGFCTPGQIMSAVGLIEEGQAGDDPERVREGMSGNVCRCGAYAGITDAVLEAQRTMAAADREEAA